METMRQQVHHFRNPVGFTIVLFLLASLVVALATAQQPNDQLTGNWVVRTPNADGTFRRTYLNLKQEGQRITGSIRVTQFYYLITDSTGGADGFTITGTMRDGKSERKVQYEGKLAGNELHISTRRRPQDNPTQMIAVRAPAAKARCPRDSLCRRYTRFPTMDSRGRRRWVGTVGINSHRELTTSRFAASRMRWPAME